jgi:predicted phosphodiesterase
VGSGIDKALEQAAPTRQQHLASAKDRELLEALESRGFRITKDPPRERASAKLDFKVKPGGTVKLAVISDTHLGNRKQQATALRSFYRWADERGAQAYLHAGDLLDGLHVHRDAVYGQFAHGLDAQLRYAALAYPKSANGPTYTIEGNHDLWYYGNVGASALSLLQEKRPDLINLGHYSAFVEVAGFRIYLCHGAKGGGSYAKSYKPQKLIEQMEVEQRAQVDLAFFGHWHSYVDLDRYQGVFTWMVPCFQAQTAFERTIGKTPTIGGMLLEIETTRDRKIWSITERKQRYEPREGDYPGGEG